MSKQNRLNEYNRLVKAGRLNDIPDVLKNEFEKSGMPESTEPEAPAKEEEPTPEPEAPAKEEEPTPPEPGDPMTRKGKRR